MQRDTIRVISPVDGQLYAEHPLASAADIQRAIDAADTARRDWRQTSLAERRSICLAAVDELLKDRQRLGEEISWQMGRPVRDTTSEIDGFAERARYMIDVAERALSDMIVPGDDGVVRFIRRAPLGIVFCIVPWNYPYLTAVNSIVPALMAGNTVLMKPSSQTPITGERIGQAFRDAGLPQGVFQPLLLSHRDTLDMVSSGRLNHVVFTGSVAGGRAIERAAAGCFIDLGLELGGKDPAYLRADADLEFAVENIVDGAFFNAGQSCCAVERIYAHDDIYQEFVERLLDRVYQYQLGDPLQPATTLGPMVNADAARRVGKQVQQAVARGARAGIDISCFDSPGAAYLAPQVLLDVDHSMPIMRDETFGPAVGVMKVDSDQQAIELMNDTPFGLTASLWTRDREAAEVIGRQLEVGTCLMNRCDYLDPALAWSGVKDSGKGYSLSRLGYQRLTRPQSFYLRGDH